MAAISVNAQTSWVVARWAFRMLIERAAASLGDTTDHGALESAIALDGLHLDLLDADQRTRVIRALRTSANDLRSQLGSAPTTDARDSEFVEALSELDGMLQEASLD